MGMSEYASVYAYLHQYLIHFLAKHLEVKIDSDGVGKYAPMNPPEKYESYESWFKYWEDYYKKQSLLVRMVMTSPSKIKKQELEFFPELAF